MPLDRPLPTFPGLRSSRLRRRGETALLWAAWQNHDDVVHFLIEAKADLDVANNDGAGPWTGGPRAGTEVHDLWVVFLKSGHKKMYCRGEIHVNPKCLQSNVGHAMGHDFVRRTLHLSFKVELLSLSKSQRSIQMSMGALSAGFLSVGSFSSLVLCLLKTKLDCIATERNFDSLL